MGDVWGFYGDAGTGKTTLCTYFLANLPECHIYSRLKFNLPNYHKLTPINLLELKRTEKEVIVVWDEGYEEMDNREFMSLKSRINSYILFQRRKRNLNFFGISPLYLFDLRWRSLEKLAWFAQDRKQTDEYGNPSKADFKYKVTDWKHKPKTFTFPFKYAKKYFSYFETMEMLIPHNIEDIKADLAAQSPEELNKLIDRYAEALWKKGKIPTKLSDVTANFIKNEMLKAGMNLRYASFVYVRLQQRIKQGELPQ